MLHFIFYILVFIATIATVNAGPTKIVLASDYRCPFACGPDNPNPGYFIEIAQKAFELYGIKIEYKIMPWSDALSAVEAGKIDGIVGVNDFNSGTLPKTKTPLTHTIVTVFSSAENNWVYDGYNSLDTKKMAVVLDDVLNNDFDEYFMRNYATDPSRFVIKNNERAITDSVNDVINKKVDVYIGYQEVVDYYLTESHLLNKVKQSLAPGGTVPLYIAFSGSSDKSEEYIKMLEDGLESLNAIGDLDNLKQKYKITR